MGTRADDHRAISADMTRQYQTMESEMTYHRNQLQQELQRTQHKLHQTDQQLRNAHEEIARMCQEKDAEIARLEMEKNKLGSHYCSTLDASMTLLLDKLQEARADWRHRSQLIQDRCKTTLLEFGLNPLDL